VPSERFIAFIPAFPSLAVDRDSGRVYAGFQDARSHGRLGQARPRPRARGDLRAGRALRPSQLRTARRRNRARLGRARPPRLVGARRDRASLAGSAASGIRAMGRGASDQPSATCLRGGRGRWRRRLPDYARDRLSSTASGGAPAGVGSQPGGRREGWPPRGRRSARPGRRARSSSPRPWRPRQALSPPQQERARRASGAGHDHHRPARRQARSAAGGGGARPRRFELPWS